MKISIDEFITLINNFYSYMQRQKKPDTSIIKTWHEKVSMLTPFAIREAFKYMEDNLDSLPYNMPKAIKRASFIVNKSQDIKRQEFKSYGDCEDCNGCGIFKLRVCDKMGYWSEPIQFCSQCDNWQNWVADPGQRISAEELAQRGILFKPGNVAFKYTKKARFRGDHGAMTDFLSLSKRLSVNLTMDDTVSSNNLKQLIKE